MRIELEIDFFSLLHHYFFPLCTLWDLLGCNNTGLWLEIEVKSMGLKSWIKAGYSPLTEVTFFSILRFAADVSPNAQYNHVIITIFTQFNTIMKFGIDSDCPALK